MKKKQPKKLKIWNGRGDPYKREHLFLAAYSVADACRMLNEIYPYMNVGMWRREMDNYFAENCWGNSMDGIIPERGVWHIENEYSAEQTKPERIYPIVK